LFKEGLMSKFWYTE